MFFIHLFVFSIVLTSDIILCIQDWRTCTVGAVPLSVFFISSLCWYLIHGKYSLLLFVIVSGIGIFAKIFCKKDVFGIADYFFSIFVSPFLINSEVPMLLILIGIIGIIASILRKNKTTPFVPIISFSILILRLANGLI